MMAVSIPFLLISCLCVVCLGDMVFPILNESGTVMKNVSVPFWISTQFVQDEAVKEGPFRVVGEG